MAVSDTMRQALRKLRLSGLASTLEIRLEEARSSRLAHEEFLELLVQDELAVRNDRLVARRMKAAGLATPVEDRGGRRSKIAAPSPYILWVLTTRSSPSLRAGAVRRAS